MIRKLFIGLAALGLFALARRACRGRRRRPSKIVLIAGNPSHGPGDHEFNAGCKLLAKCLKEVPGVEPVVVMGGWPKDESVFDGAKELVFFMDGGGGHPTVQPGRLEKLQKLVDKGVGLRCFHYAVEVPKGKPGDKFLDWIGGYYETAYSTNPHWKAEIKTLPDAPDHQRGRAVLDRRRVVLQHPVPARGQGRHADPRRQARRQDPPGRLRLAARSLQAHRRGQGPRGSPRLGRRAARRRPRLRLHRRPLPHELGRPEFPQARPQRDPLDRRPRRPRPRRFQPRQRRGTQAEPRPEEVRRVRLDRTRDGRRRRCQASRIQAQSASEGVYHSARDGLEAFPKAVPSLALRACISISAAPADSDSFHRRNAT